VWRRVVEHPFVHGLADGTLPTAVFGAYLEQDLLYLDDYRRALEHAIARGGEQTAVRLLADELQALAREVESQHELLRRAGGGGAPARPAPATREYGSFLARTAAAGPLGLLVALLPCAWTYGEIGAADAASPEPLYATWLGFYGGDEYRDWLARRRDALDRLLADVAEEDRRRLSGLFAEATRLELALWDAAYAKEER